MTPRERVQLAIRHQQPDRVPYHFGYTQPCRRKVEAYYGTAGLDDLLDDHLAIFKARPQESWRQLGPELWRDEWGVVWDRSIDKDIGVVAQRPLAGRSLEGYTLPDPHDPYRFARLPAFIAANAERFRIVSLGFSLYERAWALRGMADLLADMIEAPTFVDEVLDAIMAWDLQVIADAARYDVDAILFGDDWGQQRGLIMGPRLWRRFIKPRIAVLYQAAKEAGKAVFIHCCGKVQELFPELIELGLDVFNPFQPEVMDLNEMKGLYGDRLSFYGGMSIQRILPYGTPQEVRAEARRLMAEIGQGGGYIFAPSHDMPGDIPIENLVAMIETVREYA